MAAAQNSGGIGGGFGAGNGVVTPRMGYGRRRRVVVVAFEARWSL
jgi:hypothetical protein